MDELTQQLNVLALKLDALPSGWPGPSLVLSIVSFGLGAVAGTAAVLVGSSAASRGATDGLNATLALLGGAALSFGVGFSLMAVGISQARYTAAERERLEDQRHALWLEYRSLRSAAPDRADGPVASVPAPNAERPSP
jgi:hypothetical protein